MNLRALPAVVIIVAAAAWFAWRAGQPYPAVPSPPPDAPAVEPPAPVSSLRFAAPTVTRSPSPADRRRLLALPNGDFVPTLNGVLDAPAMEWPPDAPFSPIVGTERDSRGEEWYVHADGSRSTTRMVFRSDTQRMDAATSVSRPRPPAAILDDEKR